MIASKNDHIAKAGVGLPLRAVCVLLLWVGAIFARASAQEVRVPLTTNLIRSSSAWADFSGLADEQNVVGDPPAGTPLRGWHVPSQHWKRFPFSATIDLGRSRQLAAIWVYDTNGKGEFVVSAGDGEAWQVVTHYECERYLTWVRLNLDVTTRFLRIEFRSPGANVAEIALYEYTPQAYPALVERKAADAKARAAREAALDRAREEAARRPWIELPPFGRVQLVDEVDCGTADPGHRFTGSPAGVSRVETILGRPCRVLRKTAGEGAYLAFRLGEWKLLKPGAAYVLAVEYPEDEPRSMIVMNGGNETSRGFHTGTTVGDALHPKYVNNNPESLRVPLSGRYETWTLLFHLHDRFPNLEFLRGAKARTLTVEDGFTVAIAQFPERDDPMSHGAAVSRIRLFEIPDERALIQPLAFPPAPLPRRQIFWREEMADGVIDGDKETERGVKNRLDWYRFKAGQMRFLGINTFSKDLLEFGACQHWDPTPYGGNSWVHFASSKKDLWAQIVEVMGQNGFNVLPYYEYAGSKGGNGLGDQRRCKPFTREDAYTHISWVESANADITDPETYADFKKMLELTVVRLKDNARFTGIWLRPRWQLPMSFADATRERFAREANDGKRVFKADLIADGALLRRYEDWWFNKRREFLVAMRDYLRQQGVEDATVLFTAEASEPGTSFSTWERRIVTDDPDKWMQVLADPQQVLNNKPMVPISVERVVRENLFLDALLAPPLNWGNWEVHHANPPPDPRRYHDTPGVLMTHCFNRLYTVSSPKTFEMFGGPSGLAVVRHYSLNENMLFDPQDQPKLGYFVADMERAGPYCMMAEAVAVANGDPTLIGYLMGNNFGRGFPQYVREFNANFLALPARPSERMPNACDDSDVVVRCIRTKEHGTWLAVVNTGLASKGKVIIGLPEDGTVRNAVSHEILPVKHGCIELALRPFELRSVWIEE
jgi:hypothetical protein